MTARSTLIDRLWNGNDPFGAFPKGLFRPDLQGWNSHHRYLAEAIAEIRPQTVVEIGVWKGVSSIHMANLLKQQGIDGAVIAIDTWLGASDHWTHPDWFSSLLVEYGQPMMMRTFMANVMESNAQDVIVPLPLDSVNAAEVLKAYGVQIDMLHIDAGHEYGSVIADLRAWWPLLRSGGILIGDDYYEGPEWPGLRRAFDEFFGELGIAAPLENCDAKCRIKKP